MNNLSNELVQYGADIGDLGIDAVRSVCRELLAHREAQGKAVAEVCEGYSLRYVGIGPISNIPITIGSKLYAAPQLPAVPDDEQADRDTM